MQTEARRLNAGVYRCVVRTLVTVLVTFALVLALPTISPGAFDLMVLIGGLSLFRWPRSPSRTSRVPLPSNGR